MTDLLELLAGSLDGIDISALESLLGLGDGIVSLLLHVSGDLVAKLLDGLLGRVGEAIGLVADLDLVLVLLVLLGVGLGVLDHAVDFVVREGGGAGDGDLLLLAGALVLGGDLHDAVGVDVEGDLDLRHATTRGGDAGELELAEALVVGSHLALALEDVDLDAGLVVSGGGVDLGLGRRDGGVAVDHLGHDAAHGLDAKGQRGHVEQEDALDIAGENAALDGSAVSDDLVRVHGHVGLLAGNLLDELLDGGHTSGAADEDDLRDVRDLHVGVVQGLGDRGLAAIEQITRDALELGAAQRVVEVQRAALVHRDEREVDRGLLGAGELLLGVLRSLLEALKGHRVLAEVNAVLLLELVSHPVDHALIPVIAAEVVVAVGGENLEDAVSEVEQGDVEGAAAEVEDENLLLRALLVEAIGEGRGGGLVDDTLDVEASDLAGVLGGLTLGVIEVGRDGDDGVGHGLTEVLLGVSLHLGKDHSGDLLGREVLTVNLDDGTATLALLDLVRDGLELRGALRVLATHEAFDGEDGVLRVGDGLVLSRLTDDTIALGAEADNGRSGAVALGVHDDGGLATLEDCHGGVGGTEVNAENLAHSWHVPFFLRANA